MRHSRRARRSIRPPTSRAGRALARSRPPAQRACGSRPSARGGRERTVVQELSDGAVVVQLSYAGEDWLVREVLKEAGDAAVLEPPAAREAVRRAVQRVRVAARA